VAPPTKENTPPLQFPDSSDDGEDEDPAPRPKKGNGGKKKKNSKVVDSSSDDQDTSSKRKTVAVDSELSKDQVIKKKPKKVTVNLAASLQGDTDIEEIESPKETAEEELGEFQRQLN
jgi:hypothetical protein